MNNIYYNVVIINMSYFLSYYSLKNIMFFIVKIFLLFVSPTYQISNNAVKYKVQYICVIICLILITSWKKEYHV